MSARKRIADDVVIQSIQQWRGNVTAAAEALGLAPINLRKRLACLGVDLPLLRRLKDTGIYGTTRNVSTPMNTGGTSRPGGTQAQQRNKSAAGIFPRRAGARTFALVDAPDAMMTRQKAPSPIRLTPDQVEKLRDAKFELQYHLRVEVVESLILQQFFDDHFADWLKARLKESAEGEKAAGTKKD
jgi:hypothetical protein